VRILASTALALSLVLAGAGAAPAQTLTGDRIPTSQGDLVIHPVNHASMVLSWGGKVIYVDPVGGAAPYANLPRPDLILVTDIHGDHLDGPTLEAIGGTAPIVAPQAVKDAPAAAGVKGRIQALANGATATVATVAIEAVPMYNITPERLNFHAKGRGDGYVLTLGGKRVYVAGDTEAIPEMLALKAIDVAFLPMNLPYTMTPEQVADAARAFRPKILYPYHFGDTDPARLTALLKDEAGIELRVRRMK
jgi:L-ascorbate metabolism protein UlaG (beta-lactamase superfamily)